MVVVFNWVEKVRFFVLFFFFLAERFALSNSAILLFVSVVVSVEINKRYYF